MKRDSARTRSEDTSGKRPERLRAKKAKEQIIECLQKYPIVEAACSKVGISRSTHYEWINRDLIYRGKVEAAIEASVGTVNDVAESNIINKVKGGDFKAAAYWLEHHHPSYGKNLKATIQKLVLKPKPSPELVKSVRKYDPDYRPETHDIYMTEEEWEQERKQQREINAVITHRSNMEKRFGR